jgi:hypothetical protein
MKQQQKDLSEQKELWEQEKIVLEHEHTKELMGYTMKSNIEGAKEDAKSRRNRAISFVVGRALGGPTEVGLKKQDGVYVYAYLEDREVLAFVQMLQQTIGYKNAVESSVAISDPSS